MATLSQQKEVVQETPDSKSVGTTQSNATEAIAARLLAERSRQDGESVIEGADVQSVVTTRSLTPEEMAARILKKREAKKKGEEIFKRTGEKFV